MSHIFVSPHPDDAALSCGGLIANLRELGQNVIILSVYSGHGDLDRLTSYQRQALGFGGKAIWPASQAFDSGSIAADNVVPGETAEALAPWQAEPARLKQTQREADDSAKEFWQRASWYRRADISATSLPGGRSRDTSNGQGVIDPGAVAVAAAAGEAMAQRRQEDERYALFAEAAVVFLDLPDAVFRGYEGDEQLLGTVRENDAAPIDLLRKEIARLEPQRVYFRSASAHTLITSSAVAWAPHYSVMRKPGRCLALIGATRSPSTRTSRTPTGSSLIRRWACPRTTPLGFQPAFGLRQRSPTSPMCSSRRCRGLRNTNHRCHTSSAPMRRWPTPCARKVRRLRCRAAAPVRLSATGAPYVASANGFALARTPTQ